MWLATVLDRVAASESDVGSLLTLGLSLRQYPLA